MNPRRAVHLSVNDRRAIYDWCAQNDDIPELVTLARTISRWEDQIVAAVLTAVSNARSEALNRIAKLEARQAYSFRNPASQRRRVRTACTRGHGRAPARTKSRSPLVSPDGHPTPVNFEEPAFLGVVACSSCCVVLRLGALAGLLRAWRVL